MKMHIRNEDPVIAEIRKAGEEMAKAADFDFHTLCERLREAEMQHPERIVYPDKRNHNRMVSE